MSPPRSKDNATRVPKPQSTRVTGITGVNGENVDRRNRKRPNTEINEIIYPFGDDLYDEKEHELLPGNECICGTNCGTPGVVRMAESLNDVTMISAPSPAASFEEQMRVFSKIMDEKLQGLAKAVDLDRVMTKVDEQVADITRLKMALQESKSTMRQDKADLRAELKQYAASMIGSGSGKCGRNDGGQRPAKTPRSASYMDEIEQNSEDEARVETDGLPPRRPSSSGATSTRQFKAGARNEEQETSRMEKFNRCRRSLKIWPIPGDGKDEITKNFTDFLKNAIGLTDAQIDGLGIKRLERTGFPDSGVVHNELRVIMASPSARDYLFSKGPRLAKYVDSDRRPTAGFRVDVPDYLGGEWKMLEELGHQIKRENGPGTRRYIKYDDISYGLYMEFRLPDEFKWTRVTTSTAAELRRQRERSDLRDVERAIKGGGRQPPIGPASISSANTEPIGNRRRVESPGGFQSGTWTPIERRE